MAKKEVTQAEIIAAIADMWELLTDDQRILAAEHMEVKRYTPRDKPPIPYSACLKAR